MEHTPDEDRIRTAFDAWDANKDNTIDKADIQTVLSSAGYSQSDEQIANMITFIDKKKNGKIEWSDFYDAFCKKLSRTHHSSSAESDASFIFETGLRVKRPYISKPDLDQEQKENSKDV